MLVMAPIDKEIQLNGNATKANELSTKANDITQIQLRENLRSA